MTKYCYAKRDGSLFGPVNLPAILAELSDIELAALEPTPWYPYSKIIPEYDPDIERLVYGERVLVNDVATDPITVVALNAEQLAEVLVNKIEKTKDAIHSAMGDHLKQGIIWKLNNGSDPQSISIDDGVQKLFNYTAVLRGKGRANSHGGKFRQGTTKFNIDDSGLEELSIFAGEWGLAIQRIAFDEIDAVEVMDIIQISAYDASQIDWTIDWSLDPQNNGMGWDNDTILQVP